MPEALSEGWLTAPAGSPTGSGPATGAPARLARFASLCTARTGWYNALMLATAPIAEDARRALGEVVESDAFLAGVGEEKAERRAWDATLDEEAVDDDG